MFTYYNLAVAFMVTAFAISGKCCVAQLPGESRPSMSISAVQDAPCFSKTAIDCSDLEFQVLDKACADQACKFIPTTTILLCSVYAENGGRAEGTYVCDNQKELILNPLTKKECKSESTGAGYFQGGNFRWYCIRERECAANTCTESSVDAGNSYSVTCYDYNNNGDAVESTTTVTEKKAVCGSMAGSGEEPKDNGILVAFVNYLECGGICAEEPENNTSAQQSLDSPVNREEEF